MQVSPDHRNKLWLQYLIDHVIINYGEIEKQRQQSHTQSNQSGSSLNFTLIVCQKPFWGN